MTYRVDQSTEVSTCPKGVIVSVKPHGGGLVFRTIEETCEELNRLEALVERFSKEVEEYKGMYCDTRDGLSKYKVMQDEAREREDKLIDTIANLAAKLNE